jgi:uncharacterized protein
MAKTLRELPGFFSVLSLPPTEPVPNWVNKSAFYWIGKTKDELSIVCDSKVIPPDDFKREDNWKCLMVLGPLDFSLTGVLASIAQPLAEAKISIFAISTFETDYILLKADTFSLGKDVLKQAGFSFK